MIPFLIRFWKPLAVVGAVLLVWALLAYREHLAYQRGYVQAVSENSQALAAWQTKYDAQVKADEDRLRKADIQHTQELADLVAIRAQPLARVVCKRADSPRPVPTAAGLSAGEARDAGDLPREAAPDPQSFDPTDALIALADRADEVLADCRALHSAVHGFPTAP